MPLPGGGATGERFARLRECAARRSIARADGRGAHRRVWPSWPRRVARRPPAASACGRRRGAQPNCLEGGPGRWRLRATVPWCTGAGLVVEARWSPPTTNRVRPSSWSTWLARASSCSTPTWRSTAFAATDTRTVAFDVALDDDEVVGLEGWYLDRPGFWHGAVGVAACWAGCATGLLQRVEPRWKDEPHGLAHLGAIDAVRWELATVLDAAAAADRRRTRRRRRRPPPSTARPPPRGRRRRGDRPRVERALGPAPMAMDAEVAEMIAACDLYRRQCHAERDLEQLGRLVIGDP